MKKIGFYAGSFDPFTKGHLAIVCKALCAFDEVIIGIGLNPSKEGLFELSEREKLIRSSVEDLIQQYEYRSLNRCEFSASEVKAVSRLIHEPDCLRVLSYQGLTVDVAIRYGATSFIRGRRNAQDDAEEGALSRINEELSKIRRKYLDTVVFSAPPYENISSSAVKNLCSLREYIAAQKYVMPSVHKALMKHYLFERYPQSTSPERLSLWKDLCRMHSPKEFFHNLSHIGYCLNYADIFDKISNKDGTAFTKKERDALEAAIFYHHFINYGLKDDKLRSAEAAERDLKILGCDSAGVKNLILMTTRIGLYVEVPLIRQVIHDVDLAILGDRENYGVYAMQIRCENSEDETEKYAVKRSKFLQRQLECPYLSEFFQDMFKEDAELNMKTELAYWEERI